MDGLSPPSVTTAPRGAVRPVPPPFIERRRGPGAGYSSTSIRSVTRQNISGTSWPSTSTKYSMTRTRTVTPSPDSSARYGAVGQDLRGPAQRDVALQPDQHVRAGDEPGDPGARRGSCGPSARSSPGANRCGELLHGLVQELLLGGGLVRPGGAVRHREQGPAGGSRSAAAPAAHGYGPESSPVPDGAEDGPVRGRVRHPDQRPVQRSRLQRPAPAYGHRAAVPVLVLLPGRAEHDVPQFLQGLRAERVPPVPGRPRRRRPPRPRPRHQGQVPGQRDRSRPASPRSGISVISTITRIMNALASSRSRSPFTNRPSSRARSAIRADDARPGLLLPASSSSGPSVA